ncbi:UNVERIFIED_CONTAM: hypothetical protein GTU68_062110 [Idotea baltica]|nr:hypothetical protein [Idotea baltica]
MGYNWQWYRVPKYFYTLTDEGFQWGEIAIGLVKTIELSTLAFLLALVLGLTIALLRLSGLLVGGALAVVFLEIVRNTPLLVLLYLFYYVLGPIFDLDSRSLVSGVVVLALFESAFVGEIVRAGIQSIGKGQIEASQSIGMSKLDQLRFIVLPQALKKVVPPMANQFISLIKDSSIISLISVQELTFKTVELVASTRAIFEAWIITALFYFIICFSLSMLFRRLEKTDTVAS